MPPKTRSLGAGPARCRHRGAALLVAILAVALVSLATLLPLRQQQTLAQRERERELLFVGNQYRQALARYAAATPGRVPQFPLTLEQLVEDVRQPRPLHHLRRLYPDPMTGRADWLLIRDQGAIVGIASRSERAPLKRKGFAAADRAFDGAESYGQWRFVAPPTTTLAAAQAPAAPSPDPGVPPPGGGLPPGAGVPPPQRPPPSADRRSECLRVYSQAINRCFLAEPALAPGCRNEARLAMLACLGGG